MPDKFGEIIHAKRLAGRTLGEIQESRLARIVAMRTRMSERGNRFREQESMCVNANTNRNKEEACQQGG